jgi:hypothetical protein
MSTELRRERLPLIEAFAHQGITADQPFNTKIERGTADIAYVAASIIQQILAGNIGSPEEQRNLLDAFATFRSVTATDPSLDELLQVVARILHSAKRYENTMMNGDESHIIRTLCGERVRLMQVVQSTDARILPSLHQPMPIIVGTLEAHALRMLELTDLDFVLMAEEKRLLDELNLVVTSGLSIRERLFSLFAILEPKQRIMFAREFSRSNAQKQKDVMANKRYVQSRYTVRESENQELIDRYAELRARGQMILKLLQIDTVRNLPGFQQSYPSLWLEVDETDE